MKLIKTITEMREIVKKCQAEKKTNWFCADDGESSSGTYFAR